MMSLRFSSPALIEETEGDVDLSEQHEGIITRICAFKYGFLSSSKCDGHDNIFFHFSELSDDAKACVKPGAKVTFLKAVNSWADGRKMKAVKIEVVSAPEENAFRDLEGVVQSDMKSRGFCFIEHGSSTYLYHSTNLVNDDASKAAGNTVKCGHRVLFDAEWNHKYNPPKPFATNVRIVSGQTALNATSLGLPSSTPPQDADKETDRDSPSGGQKRGSISDRASALKAKQPLRRWSRTTNPEGMSSSKPSGGLRMTVTECKFGKKCTRSDCWFDHPKGRFMNGSATAASGTDDSSDEDPESEMGKVSSMGKASLRLLVKSIVEDSGKTGYLNIRNSLQKPEYIGRELTRDEKNTIGEILESLEKDGQIPRKDGEASWKSGRAGSNSRLQLSRRGSRGSFTGGRVSLSDMCKDPSLHSRLSAANTAEVTNACP